MGKLGSRFIARILGIATISLLLLAGCAPAAPPTPTPAPAKPAPPAPTAAPAKPAAPAPTAAPAKPAAPAPTAAPAKPAAPAPTAAPAKPAVQADTITIGALCNLSGPLAAFGEACKNGVEMGVATVNDAGGFTVGGKRYKFEVVMEDGRSDPTASVAAVNRLVRDKGIKFLFGPDTSPTALQVAGVTKGTDVLHFSGGAVLQQVLGQPEYKRLFGLVTANELWMGNVPKALEMLDIRSGLIVVAYPDDSVGKDLVPKFETLLKGKGYQAEGVLFPPTTTDFRSIVTRIKGRNPAALVAGYGVAHELPMTRAVLELTAAPAMVGITVTPEEVPIKLEQELGKPFPIGWGSVLAVPNLKDPTTEGMKKLRELFVSKIKKDPGTSQATQLAWFYDYVGMTAKAMEQAGTVTDTAKIAQVLETLKYDGALQNLHFNEKHIPQHGVDVGTYKAGKIQWTLVK